MEKRYLCITVAGGLRDQVCAEPVIRWMCEGFYRNDEIVIMSQYREIFIHLPVQVFTENVIFKQLYQTINTHPDECPFLNFHRTHPVDFISTLLFKRQLFNKEKTIKSSLIFISNPLQISLPTLPLTLYWGSLLLNQNVYTNEMQHPLIFLFALNQTEPGFLKRNIHQ